MPVFDLQHAITLLENGKAGEAVRILKEVSDELPPYATARVLLARAHEDLGEWDRALAVWREAFQLIPNSPVVQRGLERAASSTYAVQPREREASREEIDDVSSRGAALSRREGDAPGAMPAASEPDITEPGTTIDVPREPAFSEEPPSPTEPGYLDWLINEIDSARIVPRPDIDAVPPPELDDDIEDVVSETLARIYASQGQYDEAARVYELLAGKHPEDASDFMRKASEMRSRAPNGE